MALKEYLTKEQCIDLQQKFRDNLSSYEGKPGDMTELEWLKGLLKGHEISTEQAEREAEAIRKALDEQEQNVCSLEKTMQQGNSKESWLSNKLQESAIGMSAEQYSTALRQADTILYENNRELAEALSRAEDGHIMMSSNLDGNMAEQMIARTTELQGYIQNKNIKVEVRGVNRANSVDVRATNLETGKFQNYQLKFGKDAKTTIQLIERGNYNNQQIVVPSDQVEEVRRYFAEKGSQKTILDHIEIDGVKGSSFTKEEMKNLQRQAQENGIMPTLDDYYYSTKEYALSVGKNAGVVALQMAAITTGLDMISQIFQGKEINAEETVKRALTSGTDIGVKMVLAGTLHGAIRTGRISFLPKTLGANMIASIAFVGVENAKVFLRVADGKLSMISALDRMGQITISTTGGLGIAGLAQGMAAGAIGGPFGVGAGLAAAMVGYAAGSSISEKIYSAARKIAVSAKELGKKAFEGIRAAKERAKERSRRTLFELAEP